MTSRAPVSRSTTVATPTTFAPASRAAATAVSGELPVVVVSSTMSTFLPVISGPSMRRCMPCFLASLRTTKESTPSPPRDHARRRGGRLFLLGFLANDERVDPLAGVHDRGGDRVGTEGQPADVGVLPVASQL